MKSPIPIFSKEREDGLSETIASKNAVAYLSPMVTLPDEMMPKFRAATAELLATVAKAKNFDLYPVYTILATVGDNNNDDVFDKIETWSARYTPEDKPFNLGHIPRQIIGHTIGNIVVADDLTVIDSSTPIDELPERFHILTNSVVYRHINSLDKSLESETAALIEEIKNGDWYVSMECLFTGFDYKLCSASGEQKLITRKEDTAFLTKHLRCYGGDGVYEGDKVKRVLRNITFSGMGLVKKPANPESVILNDAERFASVFASITIPNKYKDEIMTAFSSEGENMSEELKEQIKSLQSELQAARAKLEEMGEKQVQAKFDVKDAEIKSLTEKLTIAQTELAKTNEEKSEVAKTLETAQASKVEVEKKLEEATAKLAEIEATAKKTNRVSELVNKGVEKTQAEEIVEKFSAADDTQFALVVAMQAEIVEAKKKTETPPPAKTEETVASDKTDETADKSGETAADSVDLSTAKEEVEPALAAQDEQHQTVVAGLTNYFEQVLANKTSK